MYHINLCSSDTSILKYCLLNDEWLNKIERIRNVFNYYYKVNIYFFYDIKELTNYISETIPQWVTGVSIKNNIFIKSQEILSLYGTNIFFQILIHEFVHVVVNKKTKNSCPLWLNEGFAVYFAEQYKSNGLLSENEFNNIKIDIYNLDYKVDDVYRNSAIAFNTLVYEYGINTIVNKIENTIDFKNDEMFGSKRMSNLLRKPKRILL